MTARHTANKNLLIDLGRSMYDFEGDDVRRRLNALLSNDARCRLSYPFATSEGADGWYACAYADLFRAWPDLERRDAIIVAGTTEHGDDWVGCGGHYIGNFISSWLDIPPTGRLTHMRYHEFYRFEDSRVVEIQALWDIPEVMMQAGAWPMAPSLGREWHVGGPATRDGINAASTDVDSGLSSCARVVEMLEFMQRHPGQGGPEVMQLERFWHPRMNWYGPAGIGTARGIAGFRHWHQIPFLNAMPDRGQYRDQVRYHFFGEGNYVAVTGWPNMIQTITHDGWLGIAPAGQRISLRSLDFWRLEAGLIRENWVLVDLLDVYAQLGVDVLSRLREFNKARNPGSLSGLMQTEF